MTLRRSGSVLAEQRRLEMDGERLADGGHGEPVAKPVALDPEVPLDVGHLLGRRGRLHPA